MQVMMPVLEAISAQHAETIEVIRLTIDQNYLTPQQYEGETVPTLFVF
ncbi:hypothetical protein [Streptomyces sp. R35]|uniref:Uncharacterized protein n=1 Tax=Streptomyces sp. R35 TaxID=3238630 RepID=A0AB39RZJ4_9ACTN